MMGGWMTYQRMRGRNGGVFRRPDDQTPYPSAQECERRADVRWYTLTGDLNRMERGYTAPERPEVGVGATLEHSPLHECAKATGVDVETVRTVLRYVFLEQR